MRKVFILLFLFLSQNALASSGGSRSNSFEDYEESWMITFGGAYTSRVVSHNESSSNADFQSIGEDDRVSDIRISLAVGKEFLQQQTFSFTLSLFGGFSSGSFKSGEQNQSQFEEKLKSNHFGGGLSVNYNFFLWGYKLQPYLGVDIIEESGELNLTYVDSGNDTQVTHEFADQLAMPGVGIRVFDDEVSLMSFFKVSMPQYMSDSFEARALVNGANVAISSATEFERAPVAFELGFGYFF